MDFQNEVAFTPSASELQQCLEAYTALMRTATRVTCMPVRWCVPASELALAYLSRGAATGRAAAGASHPKRPDPPPSQDVGRCRDPLRGDAAWYDGFKRIDILAWLLEEYRTEGSARLACFPGPAATDAADRVS